MLEVNFTPFPVLETERLILRRPADNDAQDLFVMRSDKEIMQYIPRPLAQTTDDVLKLIQLMNENTDKNETINWVIVPKERPVAMGTIGYVRMSKEDYRAEVGYMLHRDLQGKGYMKEAMEAVLDYGFNQMKLHSVTAVIDPGNTASERVLQRHGFVKEAHFKEDFFHNGSFLDSVHYSILESMYATQNTKL